MPVKRRKSTPATPATPKVYSAEGSRASSLLVVERAKTGRAKCRKCHDPIDEGEWRVGMQAWIMGRQAMTWCVIGHPA